MKKALFLLLLAGCLAPPLSAAEDPLDALRASFLRGEYERVVAASARLQGETGVAQDELFFLGGLSALRLQDLDAARRNFTRLLRDHPRSVWVPQAWMALGDSWQAGGDHARALETYRQLMADPRSGSLAPQLRLRVAEEELRLGRWDEARETLGQVIRQASGTPEAVAAQRLLTESDFQFSVQVGAFSLRANALRLSAELERRGYSAEISEGRAQGRRFHRVRVGGFSTRQEAQELEARLRREGFPTRVVP